MLYYTILFRYLQVVENCRSDLTKISVSKIVRDIVHSATIEKLLNFLNPIDLNLVDNYNVQMCAKPLQLLLRLLKLHRESCLKRTCPKTD